MVIQQRRFINARQKEESSNVHGALRRIIHVHSTHAPSVPLVAY